MKKKVIIIIVICISLVFFTGITYSMFHSNTEMTANQNIAKFIFNTESLDQLDLSLVDLNPGFEEEYPFSISNSKSETISNVTVEYQMTIKTYHLVPLDIELYKVNDTVEELILKCDVTYTRDANNEIVCTTPTQEMGYTESELDNYKLKVSFPSEYNSIEYSNLVDYINIEIKSWQKIEE